MSVFNNALEGIIRRTEPNSRCEIFTRFSQFVCSVDDINVIGRNFGTMVELYTCLKHEAIEVGLVTNVSKNKVNASRRL